MAITGWPVGGRRLAARARARRRRRRVAGPPERPQGRPVHRLARQVDGADQRGVDLARRSARPARSSATRPDASSAETVKLGPARSSWTLIRFATMFGIVPSTSGARVGGGHRRPRRQVAA